MTLRAIAVYPVKSGGAVCPDGTLVEASGLLHDRRWMVVDPDGRFLTRRDVPALARLRVTAVDDGWRLSFGTPDDALLPRSADDGAACTVTVWEETMQAREGPPGVSGWLSRRLGRAVRLVHAGDADLRPVDPAYAQPGDRVGFADGFPLLLVNERSVDELSRRTGRGLSHRRFRPNLVVDGGTPFAEDGWAAVRIGGVDFDVVKPCARCVVVDQDPDSGDPDRGVLQALGAFRKGDRGVLFGENLIPRSTGEIRVGDPVQVLRRRS